MVYSDCLPDPLTPLVKWSGGKGREIKQFKKYYPEDFELYIEPFVGGGAVFFGLNFKNNIISDVHKELVIFYEEIGKGNNLEIYNLVNNWSNTPEDYYMIRDVFVPKNFTEEAARFFYLRKTCFRGMLRYNKSGKFNIPFGRYKTYNIEILKNKSYVKLLSNTKIFNEPFEYIFENYNDESFFMFLDPPYDSKFTDYGYCSFDKTHQKRLALLFKETKTKCLMVIGKTPLISELYSEYIVESYDKKYAFKIHSGRVGDEINTEHLIIRNY